MVNEPVSRQVLSPALTAIEVQALQGVVQGGTGTAAQIPGREVAGKTGTTENYGDAWFVGFTPQLVVAVWVGYPDKLVPMTTQFHGGPVLGGTYPAEIWKAFMTKALAYLKTDPEDFPAADSPWASPISVVNRNGLLERDNGICRNTYTLEFFGGVGPTRTATCKPNEVDVPDEVGVSLPTAKQHVEAQPLTPAVVFKPAKTGDRVGYVVGQMPRRGTASAYDTLTLIVAKSLHGVVPRVVGLGLARARAKLAKLRLKVAVKGGASRQGDQAVGRAADRSCAGRADRADGQAAANGRLRNREPARP